MVKHHSKLIAISTYEQILCQCEYHFMWLWTFAKFCRLPTPRPGEVLGLVGTNGIGKSTALKILAGKLKPNLGGYNVSLAFNVN